MTQPLADAIRSAGLTPCFIVRVRCWKHGEMRDAAKELLQECPECGESAECDVLGKGGMRQAVFELEKNCAPGISPCSRATTLSEGTSSL